MTKIRRIEIAHVVKMELVRGRPKTSVNLYGEGLTPSAACTAEAVPERKRTVSNSLFTKN